jgi:hypothetical protein
MKKNLLRSHSDTDTEKSQVMLVISGGAASLWRICIAIFREIFDESAYERFLILTKAERSRNSYRAFLRDRESSVARKPRCC